MRDCFTKIKTGVDYVQCLQSTGLAAIMTRVHFLTRVDRKSTRLNSSHLARSRMPSSA